MPEVADRRADGSRVALENDHAKVTSVAFKGVREADDASADNDEVGRKGSRAVDHDPDSDRSGCFPSRGCDNLYKQVHLRFRLNSRR